MDGHLNCVVAGSEAQLAQSGMLAFNPNFPRDYLQELNQRWINAILKPKATQEADSETETGVR